MDALVEKLKQKTMTFFLSPAWKTLDQRIHWLNMRAKIVTENIASSSLAGAQRKEIRPFHELVQRNGLRSDGSFIIRPRDIHRTRVDINGEMETLELSRNVLEQDALVSLRKNFHKIVRSISSFQT